MGDIGPGGGVVFYSASQPFNCGPNHADTCNYLEAAPSNWDGSAERAVYYWSHVYEVVNGVSQDASPVMDATQLGLGLKNSIAISTLDTSTRNASGASRAYSGGSKSDWYLPTILELRVLCQFAHGHAANLDSSCGSSDTTTLNSGVPAGYEFSAGSYQSSSQSGVTGNAQWHQNFALPGTDGNGGELSTQGYMNWEFFTRPIRAFLSVASCSSTETTSGEYTISTFSTVGACDWVVPNGITNVEVLVVGGGGGGASNYVPWNAAGGAGGGGGAYSANGIPVTASSTILISVGAGGTAGPYLNESLQGAGSEGGRGGTSRFGAITAGGGGGGGCTSGSNWSSCDAGQSQDGGDGTAGGAGGGSSNFRYAYTYGRGGISTPVTIGGVTFDSQTSFIGAYPDGGPAGGGAAGPGGGARGNATQYIPGAGLDSSITGTSVIYGSGGTAYGATGASFRSSTSGYGTGGDGAFNSGSASAGAPGAQGIVIVKYLLAAPTPAVSSNSNPDPIQQSAIISFSPMIASVDEETTITVSGTFVEKIRNISVNGVNLSKDKWVQSTNVLTIAIPRTRASRVAILIFNGAAPVLKIDSIEVTPIAKLVNVQTKPKVTYIQCRKPGRGTRIARGINPSCPTGYSKVN